MPGNHRSEKANTEATSSSAQTGPAASSSGWYKHRWTARSTRQSQRIEFTWHGFDEEDELTGRGHAEIVGGELQGHLYIHLGDESAFRAVGEAAATRKSARNRKAG